MKTYKANRKGILSYLLIGFVVLAILVFILSEDLLLKKLYKMLPLVLPFGLALWVYLDTSYKIDKNKLFYRCGFLKGKIQINNIKEIIVGKTMWIGIKPALAKKRNHYQIQYL